MLSLSQQAPSSLLEALEQHLASLEGKKVKDSTAASRYVSPPIKISDFPSFFSLNGAIQQTVQMADKLIMRQHKLELGPI